MGDPTRSEESRSGLRRAVVAFGRFWWEFLIGDTPELFVGAVAIVGMIALLCLDHSARDWAGFVLALLVAGLLVSSVWKVARKAR
jgi:hypothetical protein